MLKRVTFSMLPSFVSFVMACSTNEGLLPAGEYKLIDTPGAEDFTFDTSGNLVAVTVDHDLMRTTYGGDSTLVAPGVGSGDWIFGVEFTRGTRFLPCGDLMVADPSVNALLRVTIDGEVIVVATALPDPNGITIGEDKMVYITLMSGEIRRIHPFTGQSRTLMVAPQRFDGIVFSPDYSKLYVGDEEEGTVFRIDMTEDGQAGDFVQIADFSSSDDMDSPDGMTMDVEGNLYVVLNSGKVMSISPQGEVSQIADFKTNGKDFVSTAINFGSGIGGWREDALYISYLEGGVYEVEVGISGMREPHMTGGDS